jgi:hypothetical protein
VIQIVKVEESHVEREGTLSPCKVYCIHAQVTDIQKCAEEMTKSFLDTSWIAALDIVPQNAFQASSAKTIHKLVHNVLNKVVDEVTEDFGEYLISHSALHILEQKSHKKFPLAELFKEKTSNNHGFDFHTESDCKHIMFGEAKFSSDKNPYTLALTQIVEFIKAGKDQYDLIFLQYFKDSKEAVDKVSQGKKGYVAAFSLNAQNPALIMANAKQAAIDNKLCEYEKIYLIGLSA